MFARNVLRIAVLPLLLTGCFLKKKPAEPSDFEPIVLEVENKNWQDVVIYAISNGSRVRLGAVTAINKATINVPVNAVRLPGTMELLLDPLGSRGTYRTGMISVGFGNHIRLTVENELRLTSWVVQ